METTEILEKLRNTFKESKYVGEPIQAYFVPDGDPHQTEYPSKMYERRHFLTKFTGSAGQAVVTEKDALLWTDGRYHLAAEKALDANWTLMKAGLPETPKISDWLSKNLPKGSRVGFDPMILRYREADFIKQKLATFGIQFVPVDINLVDVVWASDRPGDNQDKIWPLEMEFAGKSSSDKIADIRCKMKENGVDLLVVTLLDDIAWLLNLRGYDISCSTVFYSFLFLAMDNLILFINKKKLDCKVLSHFNCENLKVDIRHYECAKQNLEEMIPCISGKIWISPNSSYGLFAAVPAEKRFTMPNPITQAKCIKNDVEVEGMINAHVKDGVAVCKFFAWLYEEMPKGCCTEYSVLSKLDQFRTEQEDFISLSFPTISASGPNAAVIHYQPTLEESRPLSFCEIYLCDSGGQYKDGTTDITRTIHFGNPTPEQKEMFTRVLKGQIAIRTLVLPKGCPGARFEGLSRRYLWDVGQDFLHGLSHGIGSCLQVHEYPGGIYRTQMDDDPGMLPNMFLTNEPGFYMADEYGMRIEDVMQVVSAEVPGDFFGVGAIKFETITMVPVDRKLIDLKLMTREEIDCIDNYHREVRLSVGTVLEKLKDRKTFEWLMKATDPLECECE
ncbi:xaa-Pro aminopeptidase ApepP-like [Ctenocephalides felis]|uniref:xaa-Pro aminopeptidase ApepP-like n=1 Tax=Ctenocephalides felis TaxID=7515 RepID=UPI000E6E3B03|nr:xaa-Pro aminopeptidase ApepP-like [Ctenocephalides felis]